MHRSSYEDVLPTLQYWHPSPDLPTTAYPELAKVGATSEDRYLSFETDLGGWNNIRLQLEICFVLAHVTGRILLIPAPQVLYLLDTPAKDLGEYYDLAELKRGVRTMTVDEFVQKEKSSGLIPLADQKLLLQDCGFDCARDNGGITLYASWMRKNAHVPGWNGMRQLAIPSTSAVSADHREDTRPALTSGYEWKDKMKTSKILHFAALSNTRMFGSWLYFFRFDKHEVDQFYARWIRDYMHYNQRIFKLAR
jgi:hypothetical protein